MRRHFRDRTSRSPLPPEVLVLAAVALSVAVGYGIVAPAIPVFARTFGVGRTAAGAVISAFALMRLVFALAGGRLVNRYGERVILAAGIGIVSLTSLLAGLSQSYVQLLVLRGAGGVGSAMFTIAAVTLLIRVVGPEQRGRATALYQGGFLLGGITGPALGGLLAGVSVRVPFFVYAGTLTVAGGIALAALSRAELQDGQQDGQEEPPGGEQPQATGVGTALRNPAYRAALGNNLAIGYVLFGARNSLLPLFVLEGLHRPPLWTGIGFVISSAVSAALLIPGGRFTDSYGRRPALLLGGILAATSTLLLALSGTVAAYLVAMVLFGAGFGLLSPSTGAVLGDVVAGRGGTVVAAFQMSSDIGAVTGPLVAGWLADTVSYAAAFGSCVVVLGVGLLLAARMPETVRRVA